MAGFINRLIARRGNYPKTAEWACEAFKVCKSLDPDLSDREVLRRITDTRYTDGIDPGEAFNKVQQKIGEVKSMADFAIAVLDAETNFVADAPDGFVDEVRSVMEAISLKHGCANLELDNSTDDGLSMDERRKNFEDKKRIIMNMRAGMTPLELLASAIKNKSELDE